MIFDHPVYPIPPSFSEGALELDSTKRYVEYLKKHGAKTIMTTAGTSQFNLMSPDEIKSFNINISFFEGNKIFGVPTLSEYHLLREIEFYNGISDGNFGENSYLLILFPDRFYGIDQVKDFFSRICRMSKLPILAHGNPIRKGKGGNYDYDLDLLEELQEIPNFVGIKEESSTIDFGIKNISGLDLEIIAAGGSMRRFWCMEPFGATSFLSGVGSFYPEFDEIFYDSYQKNEYEFAKRIMTEVEMPTFQKFMEFGWHSSMREGLRYMGFIKEDRYPFYQATESEKEKIKKQIDLLNESLHNWTV